MANVRLPFPPTLFQRTTVIALVLLLSLGEMGAGGIDTMVIAQNATPPAAAAPAAPPDTSPAALDHLLAPIALYPDALLMQVLAASVNSQEVLDAGNWLLENKSLEGSQLDAAAKKVGFGAATTALLHFPDVVDMMCSEIDWTGQVGAAFNADQAAVLASVQRLRAQAVQYGNLKSSPQQQVVTQQDNGQQVIVIQPANPQVVYVPQYNPQTVYVQQGPSTGDVVAAAVISFGVGMAVGALFASNSYCYPRWGYGAVYYGGRPWVPAHYPYRPIYGPRWGPAVGYRPPANYPYHRVNHYNNNYFNNYRGGNNNYRGGNNSYRGGNNTVNINTNRPGNNNRPNNGYNGNRPGNGNAGNNATRPNGGFNGANNRPANGSNNRPTGGNNRPGNGTPATRPAPDRGYSKPANATGGQQPRPGGGATRPATPQQRPAGGANRAAQPANRQASAFSGGSSGRSANAASQRGASSRRNK